MSGNHTPTPWEAETGTTSGQQIIAPNAPKTKRMIARLGGKDRDANAAFIVRAANTHEVLVEALSLLVDNDASYHDAEIRIPCGSHADALRKMRVARAALALAGGQS